MSPDRTEPEVTVPLNRFRVQWRQVIVLMVVWVILAGEVTLLTVVGGFVLGWLITVVFPLPPIPFEGRLHPWGAVRLLAALVRDLTVASFSLARYAFSRRFPPSAVVRVPLRSDVDLHQVLTAQIATIVPGTIVLDARQRTRMLYLHVFDASDARRLDEEEEATLAIERRVVKALGSRAERADLAQQDAEHTTRRVTARQQLEALVEEDR